jgi:hypothetical protein
MAVYELLPIDSKILPVTLYGTVTAGAVRCLDEGIYVIPQKLPKSKQRFLYFF